MWEAVHIGISHPAFDVTLPRQGVLVLTGALVGGGREQIEKFNAELQREGRLPIKVWHNEELVRRLSSVDPTTIYPTDRAGYEGYGKFFAIYGDALDGTATPRQIEHHSRHWLTEEYGTNHFVLPAIESRVIASAAESGLDYYGAFQTQLAFLRAALDAAFTSIGTPTQEFFDETVRLSIDAIAVTAGRFADYVWSLRSQVPDKKLVHVVAGAPMISYPILCLRLGEALAFQYLASRDARVKAIALRRLRKLVVAEKGTTHPISDQYAVSVIAIVRALTVAGESAISRTYLHDLAFWFLNLYATRVGIAGLWDDPLGEVTRLFMADVPEVAPPQRFSSFMATAVLDACAYIGDCDLYSDVENDIRCHRMHPQYYRAIDTRGQFRIGGDDVVRSVNVIFQPALGTPHDFEYGEHLVDEPRSFQLCDRLGGVVYVGLSLLLRDRYFPTTWRCPLLEGVNS